MAFPGYRGGAGEPLLLVHGLGSRWQVFGPILAQLEQRYDVWAVDLPGFGDNPRVPGLDHSPGGLADWIVQKSSAWGLQQAHVVGNSMGGGVALELGRRGAAASVTAFAPIGFWDGAGRRWCQSALTVLRGTGRLLEPTLPRLVETKLGRVSLMGAVVAHPTTVQPDEALIQAKGLLHAAAFPASRDAFADYTWTGDTDPQGLAGMPVSVVWGTRDVLLTCRTQAARAEKYLPTATHRRLQGSGHVPFHDDPDACVRVIDETTSRHAAGTRED